jgi:hypothetical protein
MKILEYLAEKKRLVKRWLVKKLGGVPIDEQITTYGVDFARSDKEIVTLKATTLVEIEDLSGDEVGDIHMKYVRDNLACQIFDEIRKSHLIEYSTGEETPDGADISVSAIVRVVKP